MKTFKEAWAAACKESPKSGKNMGVFKMEKVYKAVSIDLGCESFARELCGARLIRRTFVLK